MWKRGIAHLSCLHEPRTFVLIMAEPSRDPGDEHEISFYSLTSDFVFSNQRPAGFLMRTPMRRLFSLCELYRVSQCPNLGDLNFHLRPRRQVSRGIHARSNTCTITVSQVKSAILKREVLFLFGKPVNVRRKTTSSKLTSRRARHDDAPLLQSRALTQVRDQIGAIEAQIRHALILPRLAVDNGLEMQLRRITDQRGRHQTRTQGRERVESL